MKSFFLEFHGALEQDSLFWDRPLSFFALASLFFFGLWALPSRRFMAEMIFAWAGFRFLGHKT